MTDKGLFSIIALISFIIPCMNFGIDVQTNAFFFLPEDIVYAQAKACIFPNVIYYICIITLSRNNDFCFLKIKHHHASFKPETVHLHQKLPSHFDESLRRKGLHAILSGRATQPTT